jgi:Ca-activated chloride channel homolog
VDADMPFEVEWRGPDNDGDYITIVALGAPEGSFEDYAYTSQGSPVEIYAPAETGSYEVRYVSGQGDRTLGRTRVEVR